MNPYLRAGIFYVLLLLSLVSSVQGQSDQVIIENANNQIIDTETDPATQYLNGDVRAFHKGSFIYCDTAILKGNDLYAYGNVSILQDDTVRLFSDTLIYYGDSSLAFLRKDVILENGSDRLFSPDLEYHLDSKMAYYYNKAILINGADTIKSQIGTYNGNIKEAWFYKFVSVDGSDFSLRSDTLRFMTDLHEAYWNSPTIIHQDSSEIYSEEGYYFLKSKKGYFAKNPQFKENSRVSYASEIEYDGESETVKLLGNAYYSSDEDYAKADTIVTNRSTEVTILTGSALYLSDSLEAQGDKLYYDKKNEKMQMVGKGKYSDPPMLIEAESLDFSRDTKVGIAVGKVIWRDTTAGTTIFSDTLHYRGEESYFKAINAVDKPLFLSDNDGDSLFLSADTLLSFRVITYKDSFYIDSVLVDLPQDTMTDSTWVNFFFDSLTSQLFRLDSIRVDSIPLDTIQYLVGDNDVKVFRADMQLVSDSLIYNDKDSMFTFMDSPVMWSDTTQLSGDTILLFIKNKEVHSMRIINNALVINSPDLIYFNQIGGRTMDGYFIDKKLDNMKVNSNAQCIYYMVDDEDGYIGLNTTECSFILFQFVDKKIQDIRFYTEPTSKIYPMDKADHEGLKLGGFQWLYDNKPGSVEEIVKRGSRRLPVPVILENEENKVLEPSEELKSKPDIKERKLEE